MLITWTSNAGVHGAVHTATQIAGYEVHERGGKFFAHVDANWEDIGPLDTFSDAETIILTLVVAVGEYEEMLWRVLAAQAIKGRQGMDDGTACQEEDAALLAIPAEPKGGH